MDLFNKDGYWNHNELFIDDMAARGANKIYSGDNI
jgi:hypothetical protein